jgi:hypothetical protein
MRQSQAIASSRAAEAALAGLKARRQLVGRRAREVEAAREVPLAGPAQQHDPGGGEAGTLQ